MTSLDASDDKTTFSGEIVVASRIVDYLSSGLYKSPAACLKELINNSFDADATLVQVFVKPDADRIIIADNGIGMMKADFIKHFSRISESHKRDDSDFTESGRPKIGKIGIGFIAANEICDVMEIYSTKRDSTELLHVSILFHKMREDPEKRRRNGDDFAKGDYEGEILDAASEEHYTHIFLKQVRGEARNILTGAKAHGDTSASLYGLSSDSIRVRLRNPDLRTWADLDSYSQNLLKIGVNVPVPYYPDWMPEPLRSDVSDFDENTTRLDFHLEIDGSGIRKPILFPLDERRRLVNRFDFAGQHIAASGYFYAQHRAIWPQELQGLLIRIRNAAIGEHDSSFLEFPSSEGRLFQSWISAEVWADDRLEDAMNIDRRTLREAHPAYVELQIAIHEHLSKFIKEVRSKLYGEGSKAREQQRVQESVSSIVSVANRKLSGFDGGMAQAMMESWKKAADEQRGSRKLLRKYSVAEFYEIVIEVAKEVLDPNQAQEFLKRLTERLSR
jgi:hypothetical protein